MKCPVCIAESLEAGRKPAMTMSFGIEDWCTRHLRRTIQDCLTILDLHGDEEHRKITEVIRKLDNSDEEFRSTCDMLIRCEEEIARRDLQRKSLT